MALLNRSQCKYLHRALDTWTLPPNFENARQVMSLINRPGLIYGVFVAEAISTATSYYYPDEKRDFNFASMCKAGTQNHWGPNTCIASFASAEYQKYLLYIARRAIELGFRDFAFGQVYLGDNVSAPILPTLMNQIRQYAASRGKTVVMGGQTNNIDAESYLRAFDYIFGGVGQKEDGTLETGECASKAPGDCWALLWQPRWAAKANDVFLHLDWAGNPTDDMTLFAAMSASKRTEVLSSYYSFFRSKNMGFLIPYLAFVYANSNGCKGRVDTEYSPDNAYSCRDEAAIDAAFNIKLGDRAQCSAANDCASNTCLDGYCGLKPNAWGCASDDQCASSYCAAGTCTARKPNRETCTSSRECANNICLDGFCGLKPNGWGCVNDSQCRSSHCESGKCSARRADQASCTSNTQCKSAVCLDGYCGFKPVEWGCTTSSTRVTGNCVSGICVGARQPDLTACSSGSQCAANVCRDNYCGFKPSGWGCESDLVCATGKCVKGTCTP